MYFLFDIGGTKMRLAISHDGEHFDEPKIMETPSSFDVAMEMVKTEALKLSAGVPLKAACGGIAGTLDRTHSFLVSSPHLIDWVRRPLKNQLESLLGVPVYLENDTALVGLGEAVRGAGRDSHIMAYITVSTGVGGVRLVGGRIDSATFGFEPGHQIIDQGLSLEQLISGSALEEKYHQKPAHITDQTIWRDLARYLAMGLHNTTLHWSPDLIVIGGSMVNEVGIPLDLTGEYLTQMLRVFPEAPTLTHATLGDLGGLHGALVWLAQDFSGYFK